MFSSTLLPLTLAILSFNPTALALQDAVCNRVDRANSRSYDIWAGNVGDIPGICGGLWDNLKHSGGCTASNTYCGGLASSKLLNWKFDVPIGCTGGYVESAWWEATKNSFGAVQC